MAAGSPDNAAFLADAHAHLAAAREPCATGPAADAQTLRRAYLDLLKLSLCDLAGTSTTSVGAMPDGTAMARELRGAARRIRVAGLDWPLQGLTMVGVGRLDDLQRCVEAVVADGVEGDVIEVGSWRGGASILARATLDSLGDARMVWVADSFQGFPADEPAADGVSLSAYDFLAAPLEEVQESFARLGVAERVRFLPGFFEQTLASVSGERWAIIRLDADTYGPTSHALRQLYPRLAPGGHLIVDDYGSFAGCREAVDEFRAEHRITEPIEKVDSTCVRWRRESTTPIELPAADAQPPAARRAVARPREAHVPTAHELELTRELAAERARVAAAQAEIGLRPWLRRRFGRAAAR